MKINKNWEITSDSLNVVLRKRVSMTSKETKKKYDVWEIQGYYSTPEEALHGLVNQHIRDSELTDLETMVKAFRELHSMIEKLPPKTLRATRGVVKG